MAIVFGAGLFTVRSRGRAYEVYRERITHAEKVATFDLADPEENRRRAEADASRRAALAAEKGEG